MNEGQDNQVRLAAFQWLQEQVAIQGDVFSRGVLQRGFLFGNERVPLLSPQGIFKPRLLDLPLSITTVYNGPYQDSRNADGLLTYCYRGNDPTHPDNVGLREVMTRRLPLVYFLGIATGKYLAAWPVYIVGDSREQLNFTVAIDDATLALSQGATEAPSVAQEERRAYVTALVKRRLHQRSFRERVLQAYKEQCALCRLRHYPLLDAAHIIPDSEPEGIAEVKNGIALCKLHHAAYDAFLLGITPDYEIRIRLDVLEEEDGPMLQHGLKGFHRQQLYVPRSAETQPDRDLLAVRFERFRIVGDYLPDGL